MTRSAKNGRSLFDHLSIEKIQQFVDTCRKLKITAALAGSLNFEHLENVNTIQPDIIGVRSMVCGNFDRVCGEIQPELIAKLKKGASNGTS